MLPVPVIRKTNIIKGIPIVSLTACFLIYFCAFKVVLKCFFVLTLPFIYRPDIIKRQRRTGFIFYLLLQLQAFMEIQKRIRNITLVIIHQSYIVLGNSL